MLLLSTHSIDHFQPRAHTVAIISMMRKPQNVDKWIQHHLLKGVTKFYIRLEDSPEILTVLNKYEQVRIKTGSSNDAPQFLSADTTPGDSQMNRQREWVQEAVKLALDDGITWLIHIDSDELVDCVGHIGDSIENETSDDNHTLVIPNYEAKYDRIKSDDDSCFDYKLMVECSKGGCTSYANGKGAGRVSNRLKEHGVHRFAYDGKNTEVTLNNIRILHFESCNFNQFVDKFLQLAKKETKDFPFQLYNESIKVARSKECRNNNNDACRSLFKSIYRKYKVN
jgi:hypothetical protein